MSSKYPQKILVTPGNLEGSIQHYFHFMFGYLIPFLNNAYPNECEYFFKDCGPDMNKIILGLPRYNTKIHTNENTDKQLCFPGHDNINFQDFDLESTKKSFSNLFDSQFEYDSNQILIIDRKEPNGFYLKHAELKGSGSLRRSVPNMNDIAVKTSGALFIKLENIPLKKQLELFKKSSCVILQHGAAMSNLIFCKKKTLVIEIRPPMSENTLSPNYFDKLINLCDLNHICIFQEHDHACVDPKHIIKQLMKLI